MKRSVFAILLFFVSVILIAEGVHDADARGPLPAYTDDACLGCHTSLTPGIVESWKNSEHAYSGISCAAC